MLRFVDLTTKVKRMMDEASTSAVTDTTANIVEDAVNAAHRRVCGLRAWPFMLWPREETFASVEGTRTVTLNPNVGRILHVWSPADRDWLRIIPRRQWEAQSVDRTAVSNLRGAVFGGYWPVSQQPSSATAVTVVSTSASDVTTRQITVRGSDSSGDIVSETITATGTTPVVGTTTFVTILNITKLGTWVGTASVKLGSTTILTLLAAEYGKQYPTLEFVETPSSSKTWQYEFTRIPQTLVEDNDIPEIPYPFSEILVYDALLDLTTYRTDVNASHVRLWEARRAELEKQLGDMQDEAIVGSNIRTVRDIDGMAVREPRFGT